VFCTIIDRGKAWLATLQTPPSDSSFSSSSSRSWDTRQEASARLRPQLGRPSRYHPLRVLKYLHAAAVTLKVYVDPMDAGRKCATASTTSAGTLKVTLAYTADRTQSVSGTDSCGSSGELCTASVQVNGTDNLCVSAVAELSGQSKVAIPKVVEPCAMSVPAMQPASPVPGLTARDNKEKEEGY
jgi:hypothetical protein